MDDRNRYNFYSADRVSEANSSTAICSPLVFDEGLMVELKRSERAGDPISLGRRFSAERMAANYLFRPPYSPEVYDILLDLMREHPRILLDAGCGTGKITLWPHQSYRPCRRRRPVRRDAASGAHPATRRQRENSVDTRRHRRRSTRSALRIDRRSVEYPLDGSR